MEIDFIESEKDEIWEKLEICNIRKNYYLISNKGRIFSITSDKIMKPILKNTGYYSVGLRMENSNRKKIFFIHRLVAMIFIKNNDPNKIMVNHIDGIKTHNYVSNLEWVTSQGNCIHAINNGLTNNRGSDNGHSILTDDVVIIICKLFKQGLSTPEIAKIIENESCISHLPRKRIDSLIYNITKRGQWSHITKKYL